MSIDIRQLKAECDAKGIRIQESIEPRLKEIEKQFQNPLVADYKQALDTLPTALVGPAILDQPVVSVGEKDAIEDTQKQALIQSLEQLKPWRKGPFECCGIPIDSEWRSDLKWERLAPLIPDLTGKKALDIGCNNGYYMMRLLAHNPDVVLGIDPMALYLAQYLAIQQYLQSPALCMLPLGIQDMHHITTQFDLVLCLGVLYHRRSPVDTLKQLKATLEKTGMLILETLTIQGDDPVALYPEERYAQMKNVHFLPTRSCLENWLHRAGFNEIEWVREDQTTHQEQRSTAWMDGWSLDKFLDPSDPNKTIEGYPAPIRSIVIAKR